MILPFMTQAERYAARRKNLKDHIQRLKNRYSEPERREAVALLQKRLSQIPSDNNGLQAQSKIQKKI
jgi:hypothetical protein